MNTKTTHNLGRVLIASLFIVSGLYSLLYGFDGFVKMIESKNVPFASIIAIIILLFKIAVGLSIMFNMYSNYLVTSLVVFVIMVTILYHNPYDDKSQLTNMLKNIAVLGGLFLLYK